MERVLHVESKMSTDQRDCLCALLYKKLSPSVFEAAGIDHRSYNASIAKAGHRQSRKHVAYER
jgi:hypothetical protein